MIHQFDGHGWKPGQAGREGSRPFPSAPVAGHFFNDVSGLVGATLDQLVEDLSDLLMKQGELADLMPGDFSWPGLSQRLKNALQEDSTLQLVIAYLQMGVDEVIRVQPLEGWPTALVKESTGFAMAFLKANGQIDHIRRQPWWRDGHHCLRIELIYELARDVGPLNWHKDTSGDILFSNLLFTQSVPATEWSPDYAVMSADKVTAVRRFWPDGLLNEIESARRRVHQRLGPTPRIEGGILAPHSFVSWVDDLVWHSTPSLRPRETYTLAMAESIAGDKRFLQQTYDLLLQVLLTPGGRLATLLRSHGVDIDQLAIDQAEAEWASFFEGPNAASTHQILVQDIKAIDWSQRKTQTVWGVSLDPNENAPDSPTLQMPTGMSGRPRTNSDPAQLRAINHLVSLRERRSFLGVFVSVRPIG